MGLQAKKYHPCPRCGAQAVLAVDLETETVPERDACGRLQYHCIQCNFTFPVGSGEEGV